MKLPLVVPDCVSSLTTDVEGVWRLSAVEANALSAIEEEHYLLEPQWHEQPPRLLLIGVCPRGGRVNGRIAPQLCLLSERDQLQLDDDQLFHVAVYHGAVVGPPSGDRIGTECPVCRTAIGADDRVYTCQQCGTPIHLQGEETPPEARLECALAVGACPACQQKIDTTAGYAWKPERYCE